MLQLEGENYFMSSEDNGFTNRQKSIFDQLDAVVKKKDDDKMHTDEQVDPCPEVKPLELDIQTDHESLKRKRSETKHLRGQESIFKRPEPPPPKRFNTNNTPDFKRNPHKWTHYDLSDISQDDMSERSNTAAAMAFLQEIKDRNSEPIEEINNKVVFKRPTKKFGAGHSTVQVSSEDSPGEDGTLHFRGSKLVMPEYVVGKKKEKRNKSSDNTPLKEAVKTNANKTKEIKLNHLDEYDDGDDDDDDDNP